MAVSTEFRQNLKGRFAVLGSIILLLFAVLLVRLWGMQVLRGDEYAAQAENNRIREISLDPVRGRILARDGTPLVTNRPALAVSVVGSAKDDEDLLYQLSVLLDMPIEEVKERVASKKEEALRPRVVAIDVSDEIVAYLSEHAVEFPGVEVEVRTVREYPQGVFASHLVGYAGEISEEQIEQPEFAGYELGDIVGKSGAESAFESVMQGDKGYRRIEVDARGRPRRIVEEVAPISGSDVVLTIDNTVQLAAEEALVNALAEAHKDDFVNAGAAAAIALDVNTGEVIAMASYPTYDPTLFSGGISQENWEQLTAEDSEYPLTNRTMMALYPPASTFKAFIGLAGLHYGLTGEWSQYYCPGEWTGMGEQWPKWCWNHSGHGTINFHQGVVESCDTVFYELGYEFYKRDDEKLQEYLRQFGFGSKTGIDLSGEVAGRVPDAAWKAEYNANYPEYQKWLPGDTVNMAIGQGDLLVTPLQLASAYGAIANGGTILKPHVLKEIRDSKGEAGVVTEPETIAAPDVTPEELDIMTRALVDVIEEGTGEDAFRGFEVAVAGKTGTAEVAKKDDYAWFAAFAPADQPRYVVAVVIEQGGHGGSVAGPAAREIIAALLGLPVEHVTATDISR